MGFFSLKSLSKETNNLVGGTAKSIVGDVVSIEDAMPWSEKLGISTMILAVDVWVE